MKRSFNVYAFVALTVVSYEAIRGAIAFKVTSNEAVPLSTLSFSAAEIGAGKIIDAVDECLSRRMMAADMDDWKLLRLNKVRRAEIVSKLVQANISLREFGEQWSDDEATIEATKLAGRQAAEEIAHKEFEELIHTTLSGSNLSPSAVQEFATKMEEMAEMCGQGEEGAGLASDELKVLKGNVSAMESTIAHELAVYAENLCQVQVLDTDFFVMHLGGVSDCSELIGLSLMAKAQRAGQHLDYYAKSALVLHNQENGVGHHFVQLLKGHGNRETTTNVATFQAILQNASQASAEHLPTMARLRLLDLKHYEHVHGYTVESYCRGNRLGVAPWVRESPEIQNYVDCLCVRQQPSLLCDAQHLQELESIRPIVMKRLQEAKSAASPAALMQIAESVKRTIGLGPCGDSALGISCSLCVDSVCMDGGGGFSVDHIAALTTLLKGPSGCITGSCGICVGVKPGDPLTFNLDIGVSSKCNSRAAMFTSFSISATLSLCIGGVLGQIADAIGWGACMELAKVAYRPFINKMTVTLSLPIFLPPPLGVSAGIEVNLNLGDLTPAVYKHCAKQGHKEYNCLQSMFDARGPTGISLGVDVLIGAKIPVLGSVGKWVRILGFEVAETDNSRELAMNKAGVTVEYIGSNPDGGELCGKTFSNVDCIQKAGNKGYRANAKDQHNDKFRVYRNPSDSNHPRAWCVRRVDQWNAAWGMQLEIACKVDNSQGGGGGILIPMGSTHHEKKCVMPSQPVRCHWWSGNRGHRLGFATNDDGFKISQKGGRVCAHLEHRRRRRRRHRRRRRNSNGWDMNLVLECDPKGTVVDYVVQDVNFGTSKTNYRCVLPTHKMECEHDAGNALKRANNHQSGDTFNIWNSHTEHLCARRTDQQKGWGMDLKVQCKQREQLWGKTTVRIGTSSEQEKCVAEPVKHLRCDDISGNPQYRSSGTDKPDSFFVEQRHGKVCARRTDHTDRRREFRRRRRDRRRNAGWGVDLQIECKVLVGPWARVDIGRSSTPSGYKCVLPSHKLECDADAGDVNKRLNPSRHGDTFVIWTSHTDHICARRTDVIGGWAMHLQIQCKKKVAHEWKPVRVRIGYSNKKEKCIKEPSNKIMCDSLAANPEYRFNNINLGHTFKIEHRGNKICVRRTDKKRSWARSTSFNLRINCKEFPYPVRGR